MQLSYESPFVRLYQGDSRHLPLEDGTVSVCVTSPPYMGLRKYEGDQDLIWDEPVEGCEHVWGDGQYQRQRGALHGANAQAGRYMAGVSGVGVHQGQFCQRCGAWRGAFGLEPSPQLYIQHLMVFMDEIWRVLRADGVVFVNIGDSMAGSGGAHKEHHANPGLSQSWKRDGVPQWDNDHYKAGGIRAKSLMLIPERFALACQERGWIVRSRIVWAKPNPMPESVRDRPTDAWEHIWMLTKSERYWFDQEAVREHLSPLTLADSRNATGRHTYQDSKWSENGDKPSWYRGKTFVNPEQGRNLRNIWTINTEGFPGAHFAVFPTAIPEKCILASCPPAICKVCGKPRERIVERTGHVNQRETAHVPGNTATKTDSTGWSPATKATDRWTDCGHGSWTPGLVLDPFSGAGTTAMVAQQLGRRAIGVDLSAAYTAMAQKRLESVPLPMVLP